MTEDLTSIQAENVVDAEHVVPRADSRRQEGHPGRVRRRRHGGHGHRHRHPEDLPAWCKKMGHEFLGTVEEPGYMKLYVKMKSMAADAATAQ